MSPTNAGRWHATTKARLLGALLLALLAHALALVWMALAGLGNPVIDEPVLVLHAGVSESPAVGPVPPPKPVSRVQSQASGAAARVSAPPPASQPADAQPRAPEPSAPSPDTPALDTPAPATPTPPLAAPAAPGSDTSGEPGTQAPAPRLSLPAAARLSYQLTGSVKGLVYYAHGTLDWQHDESRYVLRMDIGAFLLGSRQQLSEGEVTASGLRPRRFSDRVHGERTVDFDPAQGVIRFSEGAETVPWSADAQDPLSVFVQLGSLLLGSAPAYQPGDTLVLPAVGVYGPERWTFRVDADDTLLLDGQSMPTRKVTRPASKPDEPTIELWFAPAWGGLPVRIRLTQGPAETPDRIDQTLSSRTTP